MSSHFLNTIAAVAAASAVSLASAATAFTPGPIASPVTASGPNAEQLNAIAQALNADTSLQRSKITVQMDELGNILLTGATESPEQAQRATEVAATLAGEGKVVNVIQPDRVTYRTWEIVPG